MQAHCASVRQFLLQHADHHSGLGKALATLADYERTKVAGGLFAKDDPLTLGTNRELMGALAELLGDARIPLSKRVDTAIEAVSGLGCCAEGESLRLHEAVQSLRMHNQTLAHRLNHLREQRIDQCLRPLVEHFYGDLHVYDNIEIHCVNALKNAHAHAWGLPRKLDRHANPAVVQDCGQLAYQLVNESASAHQVASDLADQILQLCRNAMDAETAADQPHPYNADVINRLAEALQAEFGPHLHLHDVLTPAEDYSTFTLQSPTQLTEHLLTQWGHAPTPTATQTKSPSSALNNLLSSPQAVALKQRIALRNQRVNHAPLSMGHTAWAALSQAFGTGLNPSKAADGDADERRK